MHISLDSALGRQRRLNQIGETITSIATPSAAYSLRSLTGGDPLAVRVRRSSNDASAEKDFTVSEINSGALLNHINEDVVTEQSDFTSGVDGYSKDSHGSVSREASFEGKSDVLNYFHTGGRFGFRKTTVALERTSSYTITFEYYADSLHNGKVWGVENAFANRTTLASNTPTVVSGAWTSVTLNVPGGRTTGAQYLVLRIQADAAAKYGETGDTNVRVKNIVVTQTTGSGFVTTWYDQSGNGNNATQTDTDKQPAIASNGSLVTNGIHFDGSDDSLSSSSGFNFTSSDDLSVFSVFDLDVGTGQHPIVSQEDGTGTGRSFLEVKGENVTSFLGGSEQTFGSAGSAQNIITIIYDDSANTLDAFKDGSQSGSQKTSITAEAASGALNIGINKPGSQFFDGKISEVIIYLSDQTDNRGSLETNINSYYSIF
jgi:hypothetical protein